MEPSPHNPPDDSGMHPSEDIEEPLPVTPVHLHEQSEDVYLERVPGLCLVPGDDAVFLAACGFTADRDDIEHRQHWLRAASSVLTQAGRLATAAPIFRADGFCLEVGSPVHLRPCNHSNPNQDWVIDTASLQVRSSSRGTCLTAAAAVVGSVVSVEECGIRPGEKWRIVRPASSSAGVIIAGLSVLGDVRLPTWALQALGVVAAMVPWMLLALLCAAQQRKRDLEPDDDLSVASPGIGDSREEHPIIELDLNPTPVATCCPDPRGAIGIEAEPEDAGEVARVAVCGFYYPGFNERWDRLCNSGFLGTFYNMGAGALEMELQGATRNFTNAEAAFVACKFWHVAEDFSKLTGDEAVQRNMQLTGKEDYSYAGFGSAWNAMYAVLEAKFRQGSVYARALEATGDSLLLEHEGQRGSADDVWTDQCEVDCVNWLGIQLMLIRDRLTGDRSWTKYLESVIDTGIGRPYDDSMNGPWQEAVRTAKRALDAAVETNREAISLEFTS